MTTVVREKYFYMSTCMECHADPAKFIRPIENITEMGFVPSEDQEVMGARLVNEYNIMSSVQLNNCSICHR
jgi:cytochrome c1